MFGPKTIKQTNDSEKQKSLFPEKDDKEKMKDPQELSDSFKLKRKTLTKRMISLN